MRKILLILLTTIGAFLANAQTNPTALSLPVNQDFGSAAFSAMPPGMQTWTGGTGVPHTTQTAAEASVAMADANITAAEPASGGTGGHYGGFLSGNARLCVLQSSNSVGGTGQIAMAINTMGASAVTVAYKLTMPVVNPRDIGIALQYRVGTSGAFTTVATTAVVYSNASTNGGDADGPTDYDSYSVSLPAAAVGQAVVQLRWITWQPSGSGARSAIGLDDISITSGAATPCTTPTSQPTSLVLTPSANSINGSFTASSPAATNYLVVYSTNTTLSASPVDGTSYTVGQVLGGGTVVSVSAGTTFTITSLSSSTQYYVFVYAFNNAGCTGGPKYLTANPLTGNTTTTGLPPCTTPTAGATNLTLTPTSSSIGGTFTASASATDYLVVRSTNSTLSANPTNGTTYTAGQALGGGIVVSFGNTTGFSATSLASNTQYYIFVFAANTGCSGAPYYLTTSLNGNATTLNNNATGYYATTVGLSCQALKTALYNKISTGTSVQSYTPGVWNAFYTTDSVRNFENTATIVYDMYSNKGPGQNEPYEFTFGTNQCGSYNAEGQCYNREHTIPQSWFNSASPMVSDLHHLVPTDGSVNGQRGNFPFGPVGTATYTSQNGSKKGNCSYPGYSGTVFEPINEFKGDFARMQFYMATRYENVIASWQNNSNANDALNGTSYQVFDDWYLKMLYDWHIQDPVSNKEIIRNNAVFAIQGNRNPFIDSAQFVYRIWNCTGLLPAPSPSVPTPVVLNVSNKCVADGSAKGKVTNPPANATVTVTQNGAPLTYNTADSTFQYYTFNVTPPGNYLVKVTFTSSQGTAFKDTAWTLQALIVPTISISGNNTVNAGQSTNITSTIGNVGPAAPGYLWQDSTSAAGWVALSPNPNTPSITYTPAATGHKLRVRVNSNSVGCYSAAGVNSNVITFTVNTATAIVPVSGANYGLQLLANPVKNTLTIKGLKLSDKWQVAEVVSLDGKQRILTADIANQTLVNLDVQKLGAANYVLVLRNANGKKVFLKFAKL